MSLQVYTKPHVEHTVIRNEEKQQHSSSLNPLTTRVTAFSWPDDLWILSGKQVLLCNPEIRSTSLCFERKKRTLSTTLRAFDTQVALGTRHGVIELWDGNIGEKTEDFSVDHAARTTCLASRAKILASGWSEGIIALFEPGKKDPVQRFDLPNNATITSLSFPREHLVTTSDETGTLKFWDLRQNRCERSTENAGEQHCWFNGRFIAYHSSKALYWSPEREFLASVRQNAVDIWSATDTPKLSRVINTCASEHLATAQSPDGSTLATQANTHELAFYDLF